LRGISLSVCHFSKLYERVYTYVFVEDSGSARFVFSESFAPSNVFEVVTTDSGVFVKSNSPMFEPHLGILTSRRSSGQAMDHEYFRSYHMSGTEFATQHVLSEIRCLAFYTRLRRLWRSVVAGVSTVASDSLYAEFQPVMIELFVFRAIACRIELDSQTGVPIVTDFGGMGMAPSAFVESIEGCECQRNEAVVTLFMHSLARLILSSAVGFHWDCGWCPDSAFGSALVFSFAPEFLVVFRESLGKIRIWLHSLTRHLHVSTQEIVLLQTASEPDLPQRICSAVWSVRVAVILLKLEQLFRSLAILSSIEENRIHFIHQPFECVEFRIRPQSYWTLDFCKPNFAEAQRLCFVGRALAMRFPDWLLHFVDNVSILINMWQQVLAIGSMGKLLTKVAKDDRIGFSFGFFYEFTTPLAISFGTPCLGSELVPSMTRELQFDFQNVQLRCLLNKLLRTPGRTVFLAPFLASSLVPLHRFYSVFTKGPVAEEWTIVGVRDDSSFYLIYRRAHSMNVVLRRSYMFEVIIPSVGCSKQLEIPLESFVKNPHGTKLSHIALKLHVNQLDEFRQRIERYFGA
jgi:hypothetical protein